MSFFDRHIPGRAEFIQKMNPNHGVDGKFTTSGAPTFAHVESLRLKSEAASLAHQQAEAHALAPTMADGSPMPQAERDARWQAARPTLDAQSSSYREYRTAARAEAVSPEGIKRVVDEKSAVTARMAARAAETRKPGAKGKTEISDVVASIGATTLAEVRSHLKTRLEAAVDTIDDASSNVSDRANARKRKSSAEAAIKLLDKGHDPFARKL